MTLLNSKILLTVECIIFWAEMLAVLTIDSIILQITVNGTSWTSLHFFEEAVICMLGVLQTEELIVFLSLHLVAHASLCIASLVMAVGMFLFQPLSSVGILSFFISTLAVSLLDLVLTIYFSVETSKVYASCSQSLFFPLFFSKGVLLWIANLAIAAHVIYLRWQVASRVNGEIKEDEINRRDTVYSLPWDSYTDLLVPPPMAYPPVPQPRSIMKNPNNPNRSRQASVTFRGSTSTVSTTDPSVDTDFSTQAFRSAVRYPDVLDDYQYWDSYLDSSEKV